MKTRWISMLLIVACMFTNVVFATGEETADIVADSIPQEETNDITEQENESATAVAADDEAEDANSTEQVLPDIQEIEPIAIDNTLLSKDFSAKQVYCEDVGKLQPIETVVESEENDNFIADPEQLLRTNEQKEEPDGEESGSGSTQIQKTWWQKILEFFEKLFPNRGKNEQGKTEATQQVKNATAQTAANYTFDSALFTKFNTVTGPVAGNGANEPKFSYNRFLSEDVSPYSGELTLNFDDLVLEGRNGLDLRIGRTYQTAASNVGDKMLMVLPNKNGVARNYLVNEPSTYLLDRYNLGVGWGFNFPSVQIAAEYVPESTGSTFRYIEEKELYYHTGDGGVYKVEFTSDTTDSNLKGYYKKDIQFNQNDTGYSNGQVTSYYSMTLSDKTKQYFAKDGRLIGIVDRFGNTIKFEHSMSNITNRIPDGDFRSTDDLWTTSVSGTSADAYTVTNKGRYDTSSMYFRRDNTSGSTYIMSQPFQVKPSANYDFGVSIFSPYSTDVKIDFYEFDIYHQLQYTDTKWVNNTSANDWIDFSCDFDTSSATRYVVVKITPDDAKGMYVDRVHLDDPKPLLSKITDSIGRTVTFAYTGNIDEPFINEKDEKEVAKGSVTLTINAPGAEPRILTYTKRATEFSVGYGAYTTNYLMWYLDQSDTEGSDGNPIKYYYGKNTPSATDYTKLYQSYTSKTHSSSDSYVLKPILNGVRYKDRQKIYEYESVRKHLGDSGYCDTLRVKKTYDMYLHVPSGATASSYTGAINTVNYSYGGTYNGNSYNNETGYPSYTFDEDTKLNEKWTQTKSGAVTYKTTISNGAVVQQTASADGVTSTTDYTNHTTFKNSPTQIKNTVTQSGSTKETYQVFSYNSWGGVATETKEVDATTKNNASLLVKYTTNYQYHPTYHFITNQIYYTNIDESQVSESYTYDSSGRLTDSINAVGEKTQYYYENSQYPGLLTKTVQDDPMNFHNLRGGDRIITYAYDNYGLYATAISENYDGGTAQTSYQYDYLTGNVLSETKPDNSITEYQYYSDGKVKEVIHPRTQGNGRLFYTCDLYSYSPNALCRNGDTNLPVYTEERKTSVQVFADDESNPIIYAAADSYYDAVGNLRYHQKYDFSEPDGDTYLKVNTKYVYDNYDRLQKTIDHVGNTTTYAYDGFSRPISATDSEGNVYRYTYQDAQDTAELTLNNRRILTQKYDIYGNIKERIAYPSSTSTANSLSEKYTYDLNGNVIQYTDPKGYKTTYLYDAANRLTESVLPNGQKTSAIYSSFNEPSSEKIYAADGTEKAGRTYYRNEKGDLINKYYKFDERLNITNSYQSDAKGRTTYINEGENPKSIAYDESDHPIITTSGNSQIHRRYDCFGELFATSSDGNSPSVQYLYDTLGRRCVKWQEINAEKDYFMQYAYSYLNLIRLAQMPSERIEQYDYTDNGNLSTITTENKTYTYDYYDTGLIKSITYPNGLKTSYVYDNINRVTSMTTTKGSSTINALSYIYDANGNVTRETRNGQATNYTYDSLDRLISVTYSNGSSVSYQYDALNNRTKETYSNGNVKTFVYDEQYRLKEIKMNNQTTDTYTYNADGAVLTHNDKTFIYDVWGNMVGYSDGSNDYSYRYDPNGIRTRKNNKDYVTDLNNNVVAEAVADGSGTVTEEILWGHQPLARKTGGAWYYYIYNAHGDVIGVVNESGTVVNNYTYDAWGNIVSQTEGISNPIKYAGEYYDDELGMYYLGARYYDPSIGRFTSKDPIESEMNRYAYCGNNPVNRVDPSGLFDYNTIYAQGSPYNKEIEILQNELKWQGYYHGDVDGIFGFQTRKAAEAFQAAHGLSVDGIVGVNTWSALGLVYRTQEDIAKGYHIQTFGLKQYLSKAVEGDRIIPTFSPVDIYPIDQDMLDMAMSVALMSGGLKVDVKMVDQAAKQLGMSISQRQMFKQEIEFLKESVGKPGNVNFSWNELLEIGKEIMEWFK